MARRAVGPGVRQVVEAVEVQVAVLVPVVPAPGDRRGLLCLRAVDHHRPAALGEAEPVGELAEGAAGQRVARTGDRLGCPLGGRVRTGEGLEVARPLTTGARALRA